jgi:hypothetical protein
MFTSATLTTSTISLVSTSECDMTIILTRFVELFLDGLQELGIPILKEPNNGSAAGGMLVPNSLDPDSQTRSYARTGYFDNIVDTRPNFHVAPGQLVIRLLIDTPPIVAARDYPAGLWVSGVQVSSTLAPWSRIEFR